MARDVGCRAIEHRRANQVDRIRERQRVRDVLREFGQLREREEHARQQQHRGQRERLIEHEEIVGRRERGDDHREARERDAGERDHRQRDEHRRKLRVAEDAGDEHDRRARQHCLARGPDDLAEHDVAERQRRMHDRFPGALHVHSREARVHRFEARRDHHARADRSGREERDVRHALDVPDHQPEAEPEAEQVDHLISVRSFFPYKSTTYKNKGQSKTGISHAFLTVLYHVTTTNRQEGRGLHGFNLNQD